MCCWFILAGKGCVIILNKWDLACKDDKSYIAAEKTVRDKLSAVDWAEVGVAKRRWLV
jgi:predicted GTPase